MNSLVWINKMLFYTDVVASQQDHVSENSLKGNKWKKNFVSSLQNEICDSKEELNTNKHNMLEGRM
jgi:hypothetical protein